MIASQRGIQDFVRGQATGTWDNGQRPSLADRRVLLVGYGGVGKAIDARLLPFETHVTRMASRERDDGRAASTGSIRCTRSCRCTPGERGTRPGGRH
ncbi:NAD(P)-dependent oxidoreductase [Arthrobacter oryzae]|uniref:NAD(P)-dependent oxidoreductase n=1 Tax=Arthrobacter oryzae TaxID=409290 RepID=UPI00352C3F7E